MPSSSTDDVVWSAASRASAQALPIATPMPAARSIAVSLPPSPKAITSSGARPKRSMKVRMPVALSTPRGLKSAKAGCQRAAISSGTCSITRRSVSASRKRHSWQQSPCEKRSRRSATRGAGRSTSRKSSSIAGLVRATNSPSSSSSITSKPSSSERAITRSKASGGIGRQAISAPSAVWQLAPLSATTPSNGSPASGVRLLAVRPVATKRRTPRAWARSSASRAESGTRWVRKLTSVPSTSKKRARIICSASSPCPSRAWRRSPSGARACRRPCGRGPGLWRSWPAPAR